ncbi:MAG: Ig-like domain-containing protein [Chloroflexi bacterium]|nr:Ig-like domain-containing protein [Chloroflexota bacterium]
MDPLAGPVRPNPRQLRLVVVVTAFAVVAIVASLLIGTRPGPAPSSSPIAAATSTTPPGGATPTPPSEAWQPLALLPIVPIANLKPEAADDAGIRPNTRFVLESLTARPAADLAQRLEVVPATGVEVSAGVDAMHATLRPKAPLTVGGVYRFVLRDADGALAGQWAFRVRGPLRVVGTLPSDRTTNVPVATGIEVTFDQEGAADIAPFFSIDPAVTGRFERHGRTQAFVPSKLDPATVYTVTIKAGVARTGTDLKLEQDVVFRFETAAVTGQALRWIVGRDVIETSPSEAPIIGLVARNLEDATGEARPLPTTADLKVYKFESEAAAVGALRAFLAAPRWAEQSGPTLPVAGLPLAVAFTATLEPLPDQYSETPRSAAVRFPAKLARGWYAVKVEGSVPAYAFLQVTRVSAWVTVLTDRTVIWVNDVVAHQPISGATAALSGKTAFGTSAANGVLNARTPSALLPAAIAGSAVAAPIVVVRKGSDALLLAFDAASDDSLYRGEWWENWGSGDETYWSLLFTDRWQYRATDTIAIWGYLRTRAGNAVPANVDVRVVSQASTSPVEAPAQASARVQPDARGVFSVRLSIDQAALGPYVVVAVVNGRVVASRYLDVTVVRKPEYQLQLSTDHLAVIAGTKVRIAATATFFDGTPVPGIQLQLGTNEQGFGPTDGAGAASIDWAAVSEDDETANGFYLYVSPTGPELGDASADTSVVVFPASEQLDATGDVTSGRLKASARLRAVDLAAVERQLAAGTWSGDPGGQGIAGRRVAVVVTELAPVKKQIGTRYDFIEKVVVPIYQYDIQRKVVSTTGIVSGTDGRFAIDIAVPSSSHEYEVKLSTTDPAGRVVQRTTRAGAPLRDFPDDAVTFSTPSGGYAGEKGYGVGEAFAWTMRTTAGILPSSAPNRYLYVVAQRGVVSVQTSDSPTFKRTFGASDAPGIFVIGVRFTGVTYAPKAAAWADIDMATRRIDVTVTADRDSYRPGDDITLRVRAVDPGGKPVAADVVLQAVDEKLYAMGAAATPDPLDELYRRVDSGIVRIASTHQVPTASGGEGEGGSGGGEPPRSDFRDMLAFVRLRTNADGIATTTFKASDDLTAWHVAASALTADLRTGVGELLVHVGLPLFASVTVADEYLVTDRPFVRLRTFGLDVKAGDVVVYTVSSPGIGMAATTVTSKAFTDAWLSLPALRLGRQSLDVAVVAPDRKDAAGKPLADHLVVSFDVIESRLLVPRTGYGKLGAQLPAVPASVPATYTFTDAGRARYLPMLEDLLASTSVRLDRAFAASMARSMLLATFRSDPATLQPDTFDPSLYQIEGPVEAGAVVHISDWEHVGIALMPYGGTDPWLAARVAITDPGNARAGELRWLLQAIRDDVSRPRELRVAAIAGLAALCAPVFGDIATLRAEPDLTPFELINLGLAAAAFGDDATARSIEHDLAAAFGQRLGPWVRLSASSSRDDVAEMTALFAVLAARVADPLAPAMLDFVSAHPSAETSHALETAATVAALLDRTPASATSFAYTVDGKRTVVELAAGESMTIALTGPQHATLTVETIAGDVGVAVAWRQPTDVGAIVRDSTIALTRTAPAAVPTDRLVTVDLQTTFNASALDSGCYSVVEQVPSGLVPLAGMVAHETNTSIIWPSEVVGQQVTFCVPHDRVNNATSANLRYLARVVSAGTFTWEPALMTIEGVPEVVTVTDATSVRIGD